MKRQNIVPAIIILAAIMLSTFVLADVPIPTTDGDEPTDSPSDDEIVVEGEYEESWFDPTADTCDRTEQNLKEVDYEYRKALQNAETGFYECRGCTYNWDAYPTAAWDCSGGAQPGSSEFSACWQSYDVARSEAYEAHTEASSDAIVGGLFECIRARTSGFSW